ncbi:hypothetical protein BH20CHL7_BH20CHL7_09050 [soil metagenome]
MTIDKARKGAVRSRMQKTGERYAAARRHIVHEDAPPPVPARVADPGWPDETVVKGTGHDWDHWLATLDAWGATDRTHAEIARWLTEAQDISGWWAQTVTVGYERARGRRALHQTSRGFEVSVSRTMRAPQADVWAVLTDPDRQSAWVEPGALEAGTSREGVVRRFAVVGTRAMAEVSLQSKALDRTTVTVAVRNLEDAEDVERQRIVWRERLRLFDGAVAADGPRAS